MGYHAKEEEREQHHVDVGEQLEVIPSNSLKRSEPHSQNYEK